MKKTFFLINPQVQLNAAKFVQELPTDSEHPLVVTIQEKTRSLESNALMWVLLQCLERQTDWHGIKLSAEEWKDLLSAGLVKSKVVPNIDGTGFVILGQRTSKMSKKEHSDLIELIYATGAEMGVNFDFKDRP